jgi:hypothetical protein
MKKAEIALRLKKARKPASLTVSQGNLGNIGVESVKAPVQTKKASTEGYGMADVARGQAPTEYTGEKVKAPSMGSRLESAMGGSEVDAELEQIRKQRAETEAKRKSYEEMTKKEKEKLKLLGK